MIIAASFSFALAAVSPPQSPKDWIVLNNPSKSDIVSTALAADAAAFVVFCR